MTGKTMKLGELNRGQSGVICRVGNGSDDDLTQRLLEMGLLEGATVDVVHEAPLSRDPLAVRVRGALIALRRNEANLIEVVLHE